MALRPASAHLSDAELVRLLDRQVEPRAARQLRAHLESCPRCAGRLEALERPARALGESLSALAVPLPDDGRRALALSAMERASRRRRVLPSRTWVLRAAAVVALLVVAGVSARPSRAWIARGVVELGIPEVSEWLIGPVEGEEDRLARERVTTTTPGVTPAPRAAAPVDERVAGEEAEPPLRSGVQPPPPGESEPVSFTPRGEELVLDFDSYQEEGTLSLWIMDVPNVSAVVVDGRGESFQAGRGGGIRVRNAEGSSARYTVMVPQQIRQVRIRIAGHPKAWIGIEPSGSSQPWLWTVDLQRRGRT